MIKNVKNKTFKNIKLCKKFINALTIKVKNRFKNYSLNFKITDNTINYWLSLKAKPIQLNNYNYVYNSKMWSNARFLEIDRYL